MAIESQELEVSVSILALYGGYRVNTGELYSYVLNWCTLHPILKKVIQAHRLH
jgi:hypothetical protein